MGLFPNFSAISPQMAETIRSRAGENVEMSKKMAWIRVSSAVNKGLILETLPVNPSFAASYGDTTKSGRIGINFENKAVFVDNDRAYRPSPTIDGIEVDGGNMGLSRKAKFSITCYTLKQADILSQYFLEPGYVVLLEFGWNSLASMQQRASITDNNGDTTAAICEIASYNNYLKLYSKRQDSNGEYEGFMGYITDSTFSNADGETYILNVEITTIGEIPTYLQTHRVNVDGDPGKQPTGNSPYDISTIEYDAEAGNTGTSLFKQMYNKLPGIKQIEQVKSLLSPNAVDTNGYPWTHPGNFINIDDVTRNKIAKLVTNRLGSNNIPDGLKLITDESFIRLELAFEILNSFNLNLKPTTACGGCDTYDYRINTNDTIIRAHKYMFSTDSSKLFIPNRNLPDFAMEKTLSSKKDQTTSNVIDITKLGSTDTTVDACPFENTLEKRVKSTNEMKFMSPVKVAGTNGQETQKFTPTDLYNKTGEHAIYSFPSDQPIGAEIDSELWPINQIAEPGEWGYLRNLYINFNFFIQVLNRSNYVAKDVYYEILNGLSSAANSYWDFEIFNVPKNQKSEKSTDTNSNNTKEVVNGKTPSSTSIFSMNMAVRDMSFTGRVTVGNAEQDNYKKLNNTSIPIYSATGIDSPFLSSEISIEMPAAKRNQILAQRNAKTPVGTNGVLRDSSDTTIKELNINTQTDGQTIDLSTNIFSTYPDPVLQLLNSFKEPIKIEATETTTTTNNSDKSEILKKNLDFFTQRATVIPAISDREADIEKTNIFGININKIKDLVIVMSWNDPSLLKRVELKHIEEIDTSSQEKNMTLNAAIIGINFNFTIIGLSGLSVGDLFSIKDLPGKFNNATFQIFTLTHSLSDGYWKTSVTAKQRNIKIE